MTPKFIPGAVYESKNHGLVVFKGVDQFMGQSTLKFYSMKRDMNCFWLPSEIDQYLSPTRAGIPGFPPETPEQERSMRRDRYPPRYEPETAASTCPTANRRDEQP